MVLNTATHEILSNIRKLHVDILGITFNHGVDI